VQALALVLLLALPAQAVVVAHAVTPQHRVLNLHDSKCDSGGYRAELVSATAIIFKGCWMKHATIDGAIHIQWEDGDESIVPVRVLKPGGN
jgi:hypothetical protein